MFPIHPAIAFRTAQTPSTRFPGNGEFRGPTRPRGAFVDIIVNAEELAHPDKEKEKERIRKAKEREREKAKKAKEREKQRKEAMLAGDVAALDALISDRLIYLHSTGDRDGKASYLDQLRGGTMTYRRIGTPDVEVHVVGDTAIVFGRMDADVTRDGTDRTLDYDYLAVWVRDGGEWQFLVFQPRP